MNQTHLEGEGFPGSRNSMSNSRETRSRRLRESKEEQMQVMDDGESVGVRLETLIRKSLVQPRKTGTSS